MASARDGASSGAAGGARTSTTESKATAPPLATRYVAATPSGWKECRIHRTTFRDYCAGCAKEVGFAAARAAADRFDLGRDDRCR